MARVDLAGFNVDADLLRELAALHPEPIELTPETVSAAYARISRDSRPVGELRRVSRLEVDKARASNERIVFGLGHASVAEHAVFNFDVLEVSRLAIEALESHRLASYTEKSQRYVRLGEDYAIPEEVESKGLAGEFTEFVSRAFSRYALLVARLMASGVPDKMAGEDARYALPLAVHGQLGMTCNARSLEHLVLRLNSSPLAELRDLARSFLAVAKPVAPSLLRYMTPGPYHLLREADIAASVRSLLGPAVAQAPVDHPADPFSTGVRLVNATTDGDARILAALAVPTLGTDYPSAMAAVLSLDADGRTRLYRAVTARLGVHDALPREFELASMTFEMVVSAAAFGQMKRHRMSSLTTWPYDAALGITIPPAIAEAGLSDILQEGADEASAMVARLGGPGDPVSAYALLNAHRRRCLWTLNLREFYHVSRLREDEHAQWDIRLLTAAMADLARGAFPVCSGHLGGKDRFTTRAAPQAPAADVRPDPAG